MVELQTGVECIEHILFHSMSMQENLVATTFNIYFLDFVDVYYISSKEYPWFIGGITQSSIFVGQGTITVIEYSTDFSEMNFWVYVDVGFGQLNTEANPDPCSLQPACIRNPFLIAIFDMSTFTTAIFVTSGHYYP